MAAVALQPGAPVEETPAVVVAVSASVVARTLVARAVALQPVAAPGAVAKAAVLQPVAAPGPAAKAAVLQPVVAPGAAVAQEPPELAVALLAVAQEPPELAVALLAVAREAAAEPLEGEEAAANLYPKRACGSGSRSRSTRCRTRFVASGGCASSTTKHSQLPGKESPPRFPRSRP